MQILGQEHFEKELAKGRDKYTSATGCSNRTLSAQQTATSPKPRDARGLLLSAAAPLFLPEAFTPRGTSVTPSHGPALPLRVRKMSAPTQPTSRPLGGHPCGRDNGWFCPQSSQARRVLRAVRAGCGSPRCRSQRSSQQHRGELLHRPLAALQSKTQLECKKGTSAPPPIPRGVRTCAWQSTRAAPHSLFLLLRNASVERSARQRFQPSVTGHTQTLQF